jgi:hypothetical protein
VAADPLGVSRSGPPPARAADPAPGPEPLAALPLADLVRPYLDGVASIVEAAPLDLGLDLGLDVGIKHLRIDPGADEPGPGPGAFVVIPVGPDTARHLCLQTGGQVLRQLPVDARGLLLLGYRPAQLPWHEIQRVLTARHCLILQAAALDDAEFGSAIVFIRVAAQPEAGESQPEAGESQPEAGGAAAPPGSGSGQALRSMNEYALGSFVTAALQAHLADLERAGAVGNPDAGNPDAGHPAGQPAEAPGVAQAGTTLERDRLARALRATQRELVGVQEKLMALERSTSLEVGRAVVGMAKRPWRDGARLPIDLYRLWRDRGAGGLARRNGTDAPGTALALLQDQGGAGLGDRWLAAYTTPGQPADGGLAGLGSLVITGALTALSCATLEPDAVVHPLLPHDADFVLEGTGADLVLIETAAMLAGSGWAYAGDPAGTDRGRRLAALVSLARSLGKPVVLLRNAPRQLTPGLDWLAASCDAVLDGDLGVQLARFNPIGLDPGRPCEPVYAARRDPREPPAARRILDALTGDGGGPLTVSGEIRWRSAPALYRGRGLFVAADDTQAREQLAAGARVIGPVGAPVTVAGSAAAADASRAAAEIEAGRRAGAQGPAEIRSVLWELFENHATPVRLAGLARLVGLASEGPASRRIAVLAEVPDASHAQRLGDDLLRQRLRPAELVVSLAGQRAGDGDGANGRQAAARALRPLADAGVAVRVLAGTGLPGAATAARSPWVAAWEPAVDRPESYLLDLACALECARADAVGHAAGADYEFTPAIEPAVARRDLLLPGAPPSANWGSQGLRLLSISR